MSIGAYKAIYPGYQNGKNGTFTYSYDNKLEFHTTSPSTFMTHLFAHYKLCLPSRKIWCSTFLHTHSNIPLPLTIDQIYVPIKVRKPLQPYEGTYGYILFSLLDHIQDSHLVLSDELTLQILSNPIHIRNKRVQADHIYIYYQKYLLSTEKSTRIIRKRLAHRRKI